MPVDGGRHLQMIDETHPQAFALTRSQLQTGRLPAIGPGGRLVPGHQLDVERRGNQLVVMAGHVLWSSQPVAGATDAEADHAEAC